MFMRPNTPLLAFTALATGLIGVAPAALGQTMSFGTVTGTNLTNDFRQLPPGWGPVVPGSSGFIAGPMMDLELRKDLSVEVNALHRYLRYSYDLLLPDGTTLPGLRANIGTWQFPILVKYKLPVSKVRPFVELGPSFRAVRNKSGTDPSPYGITAGAGIQVRLGRLNIALVARYTHWGGESWPHRPTIRNQVELLVGIGYPTTVFSGERSSRKARLGFVAGVPLADDFRVRQFPSPAFTGTATRVFDVRSVAGLIIEMDVTDRLALEVNGLYRRLHFDDGPEVVVTWQIPVLAKYKFSLSRIRPFIQAGPSFRLAGNLNGTNPSRYGITTGAGLEAHVSRVKIAPAIRYTRWAADGRPTAYPGSLTNPNQVELLVGFSF